MPLANGIPSIIHPAASADLTAYTYTKVYAQAATTPTINGTAVTMPLGTTLDILVRSISATAGVFVLGDKKETSDPGGITGTTL